MFIEQGDVLAEKVQKIAVGFGVVVCSLDIVDCLTAKRKRTGLFLLGYHPYIIIEFK